MATVQHGDLGHEFDSSMTCNYCGIAEQKTKRGDVCQTRLQLMTRLDPEKIIDAQARPEAKPMDARRLFSSADEAAFRRQFVISWMANHAVPHNGVNCEHISLPDPELAVDLSAIAWEAWRDKVGVLDDVPERSGD